MTDSLGHVKRGHIKRSISSKWLAWLVAKQGNIMVVGSIPHKDRIEKRKLTWTFRSNQSKKGTRKKRPGEMKAADMILTT